VKIRLLDVDKRKRFKAEERAADKAAQQSGQGAARQERNRFIPDAKTWTIENAPDPQQGETLD
jgi:hypothetical protein